MPSQPLPGDTWCVPAAGEPGLDAGSCAKPGTTEEPAWAVREQAARMAREGDAAGLGGLLKAHPGLAGVAVGEGGLTLLHLAGNGSTAALILGMGGDPNARDDEGETPLHTVYGEHGEEVVRALAAGGARLETRDKQGCTPLRLAVINAADRNPFADDVDVTGHSPGGFVNATVAALLECGADPNAEAGGGDRTGILFEAGHPVSIRLLAEHGADVRQRDKQGRTALLVAAGAANGWTHGVQALLDAGSDPRACDQHGYQGLHLARRLRDVQALIAAGADPNASTGDGRGETRPLYALAERVGSGDVDVQSGVAAARALLDAGADPNARSGCGMTPLFAALDGELVSLLLERGADPALVDDRGITAGEYHACLRHALAAAALQAWEARRALQPPSPERTRARRRG